MRREHSDAGDRNIPTEYYQHSCLIKFQDTKIHKLEASVQLFLHNGELEFNIYYTVHDPHPEYSGYYSLSQNNYRPCPHVASFSIYEGYSRKCKYCGMTFEFSKEQDLENPLVSFTGRSIRPLKNAFPQTWIGEPGRQPPQYTSII
jgi:hypothetical protein